MNMRYEDFMQLIRAKASHVVFRIQTTGGLEVSEHCPGEHCPGEDYKAGIDDAIVAEVDIERLTAEIDDPTLVPFIWDRLRREVMAGLEK